MCGELPEPWHFKKTKIKSSDANVLDSGMVVFFESPHSYTGDDVVEFHCHVLFLIQNLSLFDFQLRKCCTSALLHQKYKINLSLYSTWDK